MTALWALAASLALAVAAVRLAGVLLPRDDRPTRAALALVLGAAMLCSIYGALGQACARQAADVELVFHGDRVAAPRSSTTQGAGEVRVIDDRVTVARATPRNLCLVAIVLALASLALPGRRVRTRRRWPIVLLGLGLPVALAGLACWRSVPRGYDALWYHLPLAAAFAQSGHLEPPGRDLVFYFPGNLELCARHLHDLLGRVLGASAMALVQLPFAIAVVPLAAATARRLGAGAASFAAAAIALACPMLVFQAGLAYADVLSLAALTAALPLLLDAVAEERGLAALTRSAAAGFCLGLSLGAKYAAVPLIATLAPVLVVYALRAPSGRLSLRRAPRALAIVAIAAAGLVPPAWFWYLRNLRLTGNPIFPIAVPSLGLRGLFLSDAFNRGKELELVRSRLEWLVYPFVENLSHESGFGAAFVVLVPLALVMLGIALVRSLARGRAPRFALPLGWGVLYLAAWWLGTPHEVRHLLPLVVLLGAPAVLLLRGSGPAPAGLRAVLHVALFVSTIVVLRLQLFSPVPELSVRATSFEALYAVPPAVLDALPPDARIANLAGRPYNLALLGPRANHSLFDYAPDAPDQAALRDRGATHVFIRGRADEAERLGARVGQGGTPLTLVWRGHASAQDGWRFWNAGEDDVLLLFALGPKLGVRASDR